MENSTLIDEMCNELDQYSYKDKDSDFLYNMISLDLAKKIAIKYLTTKQEEIE